MKKTKRVYKSRNRLASKARGGTSLDFFCLFFISAVPGFCCFSISFSGNRCCPELLRVPWAEAEWSLRCVGVCEWRASQWTSVWDF